MHDRSPLRIARHVLLGLALVVVFALVFGWVVMQAWNYAVPGLFGLPAITYGQAVAVLVLARILAGRFSHGPHHRRFRHRFRRSASGDSAALYSAWWDAEGEQAFKAYVARHLGENERG